MTKLQFQIEDSNHENNPNYGGVLAKVLPRQNGTPEQFETLASAFRRNGIHAEYNADDQLQANLNKKFLPNPSALKNTFKKASIVLLVLGFSLSAMAQTGATKKTDIIVSSGGKTVNLTVSDTAYLNKSNKYIKTALSNYKGGGVIKNNEMAEMIFTFLKRKK